MQRKAAQKNYDCKHIFISAAQKRYDIPVRKSQAKTGGRQIDFSEKLKQIRKNEGKPLLGYYDKFCWVYFTKYQAKS